MGVSAKTIIIGGLVFLSAIIGVSVLLTAGQKTPPKADIYSVFDFGDIKVSDVKEKDFVLKNTGTKPLQILNINSSCNCTFGKIIYNGKETKEYGMHAQSGYLMDIAPNTEAKVRVIYQPSLMPVYGVVEREVYVTTNDPQKQRLIFAVKAKVL
ncbi:MAG: DUF1573 domain-containing protein [Patescibacteria group bacterium]